jgi:hypothetical protein
MTPEELELLRSINNNIGIIVNKLGVSDLSLEPEIETEETVKPNSELLLEGEQ